MTERGEGQIFELLGRPGGIVLTREGFHHPAQPNGGGRAFTLYEDLTHLSLSSRALWVAARRSSLPLRRSIFKVPGAPEALLAALRARIADLPGGSAQLARMARVEERGSQNPPLWATWGLIALCGVVFVLQLLIGRDLHAVGYYSGTLVAHGDLWRLLTANLLHAFPSFPLHLVLNMLSALALGVLVERTLGTPRTLCVMGAAGIVSMLACGLAGYPVVVGASGVVAGMVGAVVWLEFFRPEEVPAWRRIPRRPLVVLLLLSLLLDLVVPILAGAAHLGGFVAGGVVAALVGGRPVGSPRVPAAVKIASAAVVLVTGAAGLVAAAELWRSPDYVAHNLVRFAEFPEVRSAELNNLAWMTAIDPDVTEAQLWAALALAERAVAETQRSEPTILDTLAELQFQLGAVGPALLSIDEAIALSPFERYYHEQRRRFTGERDADDRPEPGMPWDFGPPEKGPGVTV
ncbi:MAG: rhomboid family intramembrane serine protease [Myxococcales bacterium]|nr:rhomboid family intramembrane serine protease [Myxococcales bacterium]